jgi:predicted acyl esterase
MKKLLALIPALFLLAPVTAEAADPFGHACTPQNGVRFCPTASDAQRVASWDGVPLDVDVTLPPTGAGPFPTIVMMHGWGGNKTAFESSTPAADGGTNYHYNNVYFAQQGYAVITYSARGFGRSCGTPDSRTSPGCDRGWVHLADQRYEGRDTQHLLGLLVDQKVVKPSAIGVTGISYGGIQSHNLARLRNRVRRPNGSFAAWRSPGGRALRIAAAWPRWGTTDLTNALTPNGRFLDFAPVSPDQSRQPLGVMKQSFTNGLYALGTIAGFIAPAGADPTADLSTWRAITDRGEPYGADGRAVARELTTYHSATGVPGTPVPLLVQNGWTDDLFPATEALRVYQTFKRTKGALISYQFGDLGHPRGSNKVGVDRFFNTQGARFFASHLRGRGQAPAHNSVVAFTQTCPRDAPAEGPYKARSWERLHPGRVALDAPKVQRVDSTGGNPETGKAFDQILTGDACTTVPAERAAGTAVVTGAVMRPVTMLGLPTVSASIRTRGSGGLLAARLWDVHGGNQTLISRGVYRLADDQRGPIAFQLFGNGWRFRRGHVVKLELLGADAGFLRTSNNAFSVRVSKLRVELPTPEQPRAVRHRRR